MPLNSHKKCYFNKKNIFPRNRDPEYHNFNFVFLAQNKLAPAESEKTMSNIIVIVINCSLSQ